jgi:hypothetical protein
MTDSYKSPKWQKKRLQVLDRDGWACCACDDTESTLHVHHKAYDGEPWEVPDDWLQTLCESCHEILGPHPRAGVFWFKDEQQTPRVVVAWCPQCSCYEFRDEGENIRCRKCGWDTSIYCDHGFAVGPSMMVTKDKPPKEKPKQYSANWLASVISKAREKGLTDEDIMIACFPESSVLAELRRLSREMCDLTRELKSGDLSCEHEAVLLELLVKTRRRIQSVRKVGLVIPDKAAPFGWSIGDDNALTPVPEEQRVIEEIMRCRLAGMRWESIASLLCKGATDGTAQG